MEVYFGWIEVGGHFSWVGKGGWSGGIFWVSGSSLVLVKPTVYCLFSSLLFQF